VTEHEREYYLECTICLGYGAIILGEIDEVGCVACNGTGKIKFIDHSKRIDLKDLENGSSDIEEV